MGIMDKWYRARNIGMSVDIANKDKFKYYPDIKMKIT